MYEFKGPCAVALPNWQQVKRMTTHPIIIPLKHLSQAPEHVSGEHPRKRCFRMQGAPDWSTEATQASMMPRPQPAKGVVW